MWSNHTQTLWNLSVICSFLLVVAVHNEIKCFIINTHHPSFNGKGRSVCCCCHLLFSSRFYFHPLCELGLDFTKRSQKDLPLYEMDCQIHKQILLSLFCFLYFTTCFSDKQQREQIDKKWWSGTKTLCQGNFDILRSNLTSCINYHWWIQKKKKKGKEKER